MSEQAKLRYLLGNGSNSMEIPLEEVWKREENRVHNCDDVITTQ